MNTKPLIVSTSLEFWHLSEEAQVLYQVLQNGFLTNTWVPIRPLVLELNYLLWCRGLTYDSDEGSLLHACLVELSEASLIGFYWDLDKGPHIRNKLGKFTTKRLPNKQELVNKLVDVLGSSWVEFDQMYLAHFGQVMRSSGVDWDSNDQLLRFFAAFRRLHLLELQMHITGLLVTRVAPKMRSLYSRSGTSERRVANDTVAPKTHVRINKNRRTT